MKKKAIIIGNSNYIEEKDVLGCTIKDANVMDEMLSTIGAVTDVYFDLDFALMENSITSFFEKLNQDDIVIIYFSGHGCSIEGENYLVPIDYSDYCSSIGMLKTHMISLGSILERHNHDKNKLVIIADACRSRIDKYEKQVKSFVDMKFPPNVFIAFATQQYEGAYPGKDISPYTESIARNILKPNIGLSQLFIDVRTDLKSKEKIQVSTELNSLMDGDIILNPLINVKDIHNKVYEFIESNASKWEEKIKNPFLSEFKMFLEASEYFGIPLLDTYVFYEFVSKYKYKMTMIQEADSKAITFKHLSESNLIKEFKYRWFHDGEQIRLGEIPPFSSKMMPLKPISNCEIDVNVRMYNVSLNKITLRTNLPDGFRLYYKLDNKYGTSIEACNGKIVIENEKINECRTLNINSIAYNIMDKNVKEIIGYRARNLVGDLIRFDEISGNMVEYSSEYELIDRGCA